VIPASGLDHYLNFRRKRLISHDIPGFVPLSTDQRIDWTAKILPAMSVSEKVSGYTKLAHNDSRPRMPQFARKNKSHMTFVK
jgi:hypothetical protein